MGALNFVSNKLGFKLSSGSLGDIVDIGRGVEYPWVLQRLPPSGNVLDVGCATSFFAVILSKLGYQTYAIDLDEYTYARTNLHFSKQDIRKTVFKNNFFDAVVFVSTLEHIGMYDKGSIVPRKINSEDFRAIAEAHRILKLKGKVLVTLPYGRELSFHDNWNARIYDEDRIAQLFSNFKIIAKDYFVEKDTCAGFIKSTKHQAGSDEFALRSLVCVAAEKS